MSPTPAGGERESDEDYLLMGAALEAARAGRPSPNPHVGAVLAQEGSALAIGHHARAGEDHAEIAVLKAAGDAARGGTLYCTLEPCNHFGRTPPCTDAILAAGVRRVVISARDPSPHAPGAIAKLEAAGVHVTVGVRQSEGRELIADFARHVSTGLPYVILKAAVTLDGRTATRTGDSKWITGIEARTEVHRMRDRADAILVGVDTVLLDDPSLDVRHAEGRDPIRVVLDTHLRTPPGAKLVAHRSAQPTWILHGPEASVARRAGLTREGVELIEIPVEEAAGGVHVAIEAALRELARRDVVRLLVEGGATVHGALLRHGLACRAAIFIAPIVLGDPEARPLAIGPPVERITEGWRLRAPRLRQLGDDVLVEGELL